MPRDQPRLRGVRVLLLVAVTLFSPQAFAQEVSGSIRGRVTGAVGEAMESVRVIARSPELTADRETLTSREGNYFFGFLPAGEYVVTFERTGFFAVKRQTSVSALETVYADAVLYPARNPEEAILVSIDPNAFLQSPPISENYREATLDRLPLAGGLMSALTLSSGPIGSRANGALITFDGAPVRLTPGTPGPPLLDPGPAALQETTIVTGSVPAQAGRLENGLIAVVTRPGGDRFSGAIDTTIGGGDMNTDDVEAARTSEDVPARMDYRIGGPLNGRRTWFFAAGHRFSESVASRTPLSDTTFSSRTVQKFWELKATHAMNANHRVQGVFVTANRNVNDAPPTGAVSVEDTAALEDRVLSQRLASAVYTGVWNRGLQLAARITAERSQVDVRGRDRLDLVGRTAVRDRQTGSLIGAPGTCAGCDPDQRGSTTWGITANRLLPAGSDTHQITAGYDGSFGRIEPAGVHPGGAFEVYASRFEVRNGRVFPVLESNGSTTLVWRPESDSRLTYNTMSFFVDDEWRRGSNITVRAGLRWDGHRLSTLDSDRQILTERGFSPRLSVSWHPSGHPDWLVTSGYARYTADLLARLDAPLVGPAERGFTYTGSPVNASLGDAGLVETPDVIDGALSWLSANGGTTRAPSFVFEPGLTAIRSDSGDLPDVSEWTVSAGRRILGDARLRADFIWRRAGNFREWNVDPAGRVADANGHDVDQATASDANVLTKNYAGLAVLLDYKLGIQASLAARYTLSRLWGNADGSQAPDNSLAIAPLAYPEYVDLRWAAPSGDLPDDRRHRLNFWAHADVLVSETYGTVGLDLLQTVESGRPYGLVSLIDVSPFITNPGYEQPPVAVPYYFTSRDQFRTKTSARTDLSANYKRLIPGTLRTEFLVQFQVLNLFNKRRTLDSEQLVSVATAFTDPARLVPFNPFSDSPEEGRHWSVDRRDSGTFGLTLPRAYRLSVGIRF